MEHGLGRRIEQHDALVRIDGNDCVHRRLDHAFEPGVAYRKIVLGLLVCRDVEGGSKTAGKLALLIELELGSLAHPLLLVSGDNLTLGVEGRAARGRLPGPIDHFMAGALDGREKGFVAEGRPFRDSENAIILVRPQELLTVHIEAPGTGLLHGLIALRLKLPAGPGLLLDSPASSAAQENRQPRRGGIGKDLVEC